MKPDFDSSDCRVLSEFVEKPSYQVGPALLRSPLKCQEFLWTSFKSEAATHVNKIGCSLPAIIIIDSHHFFTLLLYIEEGLIDFFLAVLDVVVLLQLPGFSCVDLTLLRPNSDLLKLARHLQISLSDSGRYAKELSKSRRVKKFSSKDKHPKTCGSSMEKEVVGEKQDSKRKNITVNYFYSNWSCYLFGDYLNGEFVAALVVPSDLREAAFIAYWLSKYVFLGLGINI
ncbi:hypothetical protein AHAS_Ahas16G0159100 [Arachis hypogaea]